MRCLKYVAHLFILFIIMVTVIDAEDATFHDNCQERLNCFSNCNRAYFPSLACKDVENEVVEVYGNKFDRFYKYPKPDYVKLNFEQQPMVINEPVESEADVVVPATERTTYATDMTLIQEDTFAKYQQEYQKCYDFSQQILDYKKAIDGSGRQVNLHTCFENCKDYIYDDYKFIYTIDTRVNCTEYDQDENEDHERYLLCLYPDEKCE